MEVREDLPFFSLDRGRRQCGSIVNAADDAMYSMTKGKNNDDHIQRHFGSCKRNAFSTYCDKPRD